MDPSMLPPVRLEAPQVSYRARNYVVVFTILETLAITTVLLRFIARNSSRAIAIDDWLILLALLLSLGIYVSGMYAMIAAFGGFHIWELYPDQIALCLKMVYVNNVFYSLTLPAVKFSLLCMYWKIFKRVKPFRIASIILGVVVFGWMVSTLLSQVFTCNPIRGAWEFWIGAKCIDQVKFYYGNAISNVITDVAILVLPLWLVWQLQLSFQKRVALTFVILLGGMVCVSSILRIVTFSGIDADITYSLARTAVWTAVEVPLAIICACLPTLPGLIRTWHEKILSSRATHGSILSKLLGSRATTKQSTSGAHYDGMRLGSVNDVYDAKSISTKTSISRTGHTM